MRKDKEKANIMRRSGMTYSEIKEQLGVARSTLSEWFSGQEWSNEIARKSARIASQRSIVRLVVLNTVRGTRLKKLYEDARQEAILDFEDLKYHPLFISGLMIYWGEGDKTSKYRVSIANTEPKMVRIFRLFLEKICGCNNIKVWLLLYPDLAENECKEFWMTKCGLKPEQFTKSIVIKGRSKTKRLSYGVCNIGMSSAYLKNKILKWIELMSIEIDQEKYLDKADQ